MLLGARSTTGNFTGHWINSKNNSGQYKGGSYGDGYGMISITRSYWREQPREESEVYGTFKNRDGKQRGFIFNFKLECV